MLTLGLIFLMILSFFCVIGVSISFIDDMSLDKLILFSMLLFIFGGSIRWNMYIDKHNPPIITTVTETIQIDVDIPIIFNVREGLVYFTDINGKVSSNRMNSEWIFVGDTNDIVVTEITEDYNYFLVMSNDTSTVNTRMTVFNIEMIEFYFGE